LFLQSHFILFKRLKAKARVPTRLPSVDLSVGVEKVPAVSQMEFIYSISEFVDLSAGMEKIPAVDLRAGMEKIPAVDLRAGMEKIPAVDLRAATTKAAIMQIPVKVAAKDRITPEPLHTFLPCWLYMIPRH